MSLSAFIERRLQHRLEAGRQVDNVRAGAEHRHQPLHLRQIPAYGGIAVFGHGMGRDRGRHVGIAIAVAADPRSIAHEGGNSDRLFRIVTLEGALELAIELRRRLEDDFAKEMQAPGDFAFDRRALQPQFTRHPQKLDFAFQIGDQQVALARRPARLVELGQLAIDTAVDLQHRDALGLRRVRGHGRADTKLAERRLDFFRGVTVRCHLRDHAGKGPGHLIDTGALFEFAARPHGKQLVGNRQQLEPYAARLERRDALLGGEGDKRPASAQNGGDLRLARACDLKQQAQQKAALILTKLDASALFQSALLIPSASAAAVAAP